MALDATQYYKNIVRFTSECEDQFVDAPGNAALFLASGSDDVDNNGHVLERLQQEALLPLGQACTVPPGQVLILSSAATTIWHPELGGQQHGGWPPGCQMTKARAWITCRSCPASPLKATVLGRSQPGVLSSAVWAVSPCNRVQNDFPHLRMQAPGGGPPASAVDRMTAIAQDARGSWTHCCSMTGALYRGTTGAGTGRPRS